MCAHAKSGSHSTSGRLSALPWFLLSPGFSELCLMQVSLPSLWGERSGADLTAVVWMPWSLRLLHCSVQPEPTTPGLQEVWVPPPSHVAFLFSFTFTESTSQPRIFPSLLQVESATAGSTSVHFTASPTLVNLKPRWAAGKGTAPGKSSLPPTLLARLRAYLHKCINRYMPPITLPRNEMLVSNNLVPL